MPVAARDFATGWQDANGARWGRPVGVVVAPDGSLIVSDDDVGVALPHQRGRIGDDHPDIRCPGMLLMGRAKHGCFSR